jgi:hypothetical protein
MAKKEGAEGRRMRCIKEGVNRIKIYCICVEKYHKTPHCL